MTDPLPASACPDCGAPLPPESPQALCPACLMRQALASRTLVNGEVKTSAAPPPSPEEIADKFPGYEILECLGRGGMGVVYKARQKSLNRIVAIKILAPERVDDGRFADRFTIEAELLAKLSHPHIVTIHDFGITDSQPSTINSQPLYYLVMEFIDGVNLRDLLRDGKLEAKQALAIVPPVCDALQYAHDKGIVHRDIKPENLLLDREGRIKIADFGIAKLIEPVASVYDRRSSDEDDQRKTAATLNAGTLGYSAPEQSSDPQHVDQRADIYSLGVVLYEMLTGERPNKDLVAPSKKVHIDVRLDEIVLRALEKTPELRYQTAGLFKTQVETLVSEMGSARASRAVSGAPAGNIEPQPEEAAVSQSGTKPDSEKSSAGAQTTAREARALPESSFSRTAIAGACWLAFMPLHFLFPLILPPGWQHNALIELLAFLQAMLFWSAPLGVTFLGWTSVSKIRRSAGKLHGMWLAVFDGLLFPLLALDALLIGLPITAWKRMPWEAPPQPELLFITFIVLSVLAAVWLDWLIIRRVLRAVNSNNPTAPQQSGSTDKPARCSRKAIHIAACVFVALSFAVLFTKQWNERKREGVWVPARISNTITQQYGDAQIRVVDVSQAGQVVVVSFTCEMFRPDHELMVQYGGPVLSYPNDLASSVKAKEKDLDCLITPRAKLVGDNIGEVLAGTNVLSDQAMLRAGFVLPDSQTAAQVVKAVQEVHLGKPRGLGKDKGVLLLFSLRRDFGKDAAGKPVVEALDATLWSRPKSNATAAQMPGASSELSFGPVMERVALPEDPAWGAPDQGASVRLRADKAQWTGGEIPSLKMDMRNQGNLDLTSLQSQEFGRLEVDGVAYRWTGACRLSLSPFPPGQVYTDIPITLGMEWMQARDRVEATPPPPLRLAPGRHVIHFAPSIRVPGASKSDRGPSIASISNPVEIEIVDSKDPATVVPMLWGEAVNRVAVHLQADLTAWTADEFPIVTAHVRNHGSTALPLSTGPTGNELEVDGKWHAWHPAQGDESPHHSELAPGAECAIPLTLSGDWQAQSVPLSLGLGQHVIRFAIRAKTAAGKETIRVISNPIRIDIVDGIYKRAALVARYLPGHQFRSVRTGPAGLEEMLLAPDGSKVNLAEMRKNWWSFPNPHLTAFIRPLRLKITTAAEAQDITRIVMTVLTGGGNLETWEFRAKSSSSGWHVEMVYVGPPAQIPELRPIELIVQDGLLVDVANVEIKPAPMIMHVSIAADGALTVAGEPCPPDQLADRIKKLAGQESVSIKIHADKKTPYRQVRAVLDACAAAGIKDIAFSAEKP